MTDPDRTGPGAAGLTRREVLRAGAVGAGALLAVRPWSPAIAGQLSLNEYIRDRMAAGRIPGLSATVLRHGRPVWTHVEGVANVARQEPVRLDTIFMLASVSKTAVATAVMQAVEDGLLELDADVGDVLPFPVRNPSYPNRVITLRQLLTHTSSLRDHWPQLIRLYVRGDSTIPLSTFMERYLVPGGDYYHEGNAYAFPPGHEYRYCNVAVSLAAYMVEAASGTPFETWSRDRIFGPLGMTDTGWRLAEVRASQVATPTRWSNDTHTYEGRRQYGYPDYPDGELRTTATSLGRHLAMFSNGGALDGVRVLSEESVRAMVRRQVPDISPGQGLVWYRSHPRGRELIGHNGGDSGVATVCFHEPATDTGVIVLANGNWRYVRGAWPLQQIMMRLFDEADRLAG